MQSRNRMSEVRLIISTPLLSDVQQFPVAIIGVHLEQNHLYYVKGVAHSQTDYHLTYHTSPFMEKESALEDISGIEDVDTVEWSGRDERGEVVLHIWTPSATTRHTEELESKIEWDFHTQQPTQKENAWLHSMGITFQDSDQQEA